MNNEEIIEIGKRIFNFSPDEKFKSCTHVLEVAWENCGYDYYQVGASTYARYLAKHIDAEVAT